MEVDNVARASNSVVRGDTGEGAHVRRGDVQRVCRDDVKPSVNEVDLTGHSSAATSHASSDEEAIGDIVNQSTKYPERKNNPKPMYGAHLYEQTAGKWTVICTEHRENKQYQSILAERPPTTKNRRRKGSAQQSTKKPGTPLWEKFEPKNESLTNFYPVVPDELTKKLVLFPDSGHPGQLPTPQHILAVRWETKYESQRCQHHTQGCGHQLKAGDVVVVDGRECIYVTHNVYEISVMKIRQGLKRGCKVGVVRVVAPFLHYFVGRYYMVGYKSPLTTPSDNKRSFKSIVKGYYHLHLMNCTDCVPPEYPAGSSNDSTLPFVRISHYNPELPTEEEFVSNQARRVSREERGTTGKQSSKKRKTRGEDKS
jgi:hypothetical protein